MRKSFWVSKCTKLSESDIKWTNEWIHFFFSSLAVITFPIAFGRNESYRLPSSLTVNTFSMASSVRAATRLCSFYLFTSSRHNVSSGFSWSCRLCSSRPIRSSLYEHVLEGYSHKPKLDMQRVCEETDAVKREVENRKGDLRAADVGLIVRHSITCRSLKQYCCVIRTSMWKR